MALESTVQLQQNDVNKIPEKPVDREKIRYGKMGMLKRDSLAVHKDCSNCYLNPVAWTYLVTTSMHSISPQQVFLVIWRQILVPRTHILKEIMGKSKYIRRKKSPFQHGNNMYLKRNRAKCRPDQLVNVQYVRPTPEEQKLLENPPIHPDNLPGRSASEKPSTRTVFLRSHCTRASTSSTDRDDPLEPDNANSYKLVHTQKLWEMVNTAMKEHRFRNPSCEGNLGFDQRCEEQRGLVWREAVVCDRCGYQSSTYNLYEEIRTGQRGRRAATANVGFNIAMTQTPAAATSVIKMLLGGNIPAPSKTGMYRCASKVSKIIQKENRADMKRRREQLKKLNRWQNLPENNVAVQSDGTYNNPLYSGVGRTPFQPATQCAYVVAENQTSQKQIIALETVNKLCSKNGFHTADDEPCDIKSGACSATACIETNIGDEQNWAKMSFEDLLTDNLEVSVLTTDPDTKAYQAAMDLHENKQYKTCPQHQIDTRHLSQNHRKRIKNNVHVLNMMPGLTRTYRLYLRNRFSADISRRCQAEFNMAHTAVRGNFEDLISAIHKCIIAIKRCYCGDHSYCKLYSYVCKGEDNDNWLSKSCYLRPNFRINASKPNNEQALLECIEYRLSDDMVELTRLNSNSQKVEAFNRSLKRSLPKNVTFSKNFPGRAHSAVHSVNNGPGNSIRRLCDVAGCPIPKGSKVDKGLEALQKSCEKQKAREKSLDAKYKRKVRRDKMYKIYEKHQEQKNYIKGLLLKIKRRAARTVARKQQIRRTNLPKDHAYHRMPSSNQMVRGKRHGGVCPSMQDPADAQ